jgi:polyisoprenoid-binding protein YceI
MSERPAARSRTVDGISLPPPGVYDVDPVHTFVAFRARHLVVGRVDGRFTAFQGQFTVGQDPARPLDHFEVTFETASLDTHVKMRDDDLRSARFLDAEHFPTIHLSGGTSSRGEGDQWTVDAELTIRGVTRPVSLEVSFRGMAVDEGGKTKAALTVAAKIYRSDFELTTELREESGEPGTGPDVEIRADVEAFLREDTSGISSAT